MTSVKKLGSSYIVSTSYNTFLFDYTQDSCPLVDTIFISNSSNLEVLYIAIDVPIYISEPVYTQLLYKHKLQNNREVSPLFFKNCIFISYNQILKFNKTEITVLSSGLYFGWCMFKINNTFLYFSDISFTNKLCTRNSDIKEIDYILWSNFDKEGRKDHIENFNNALTSSLNSDKDILKSTNNVAMHFLNKTIDSQVEIFVEFPNFLLDIMLHINSFFKKPVRIDCPYIERYINNVKSATDWINDKYSKITFNINENSNIMIRNLDTEDDNYTIKINRSESSYFKIDTKAIKQEISRNIRGLILDAKDGIYYSIPTFDYEDVFVDGKIDIVEDIGYLTGDITNTDKYEYMKTVSLSDNVDLIKYLFDNERYVIIEGIYYFIRLGLKIYEKDNGFKILI